jgi:signal transduction histidine kinase
MSKLKGAILWSGLILIVLLAVLSIYGAFLGADGARRFFNSVPAAVYWIALAVVLTVGIVVFPRLARVPSLVLIHAGCIFILVGGIWGSQAGHKLQKKLFGIDKIRAGQMFIYEQASENRVLLEDSDEVRELPFHVGLNDFKIEYYQPGYLLIQSQKGKSRRIPAQVGSELDLGEDFGKIKISRVFENCEIKIEGDNPIGVESTEPGSNPAIEVQIEKPKGDITTRYVFERFGGHPRPEDKFEMKYIRLIRDYISELEIIRNGEAAAAKQIEVNHPLHYGGYHFYQHSYDTEQGLYTVLMVVSDTGLNVVYAGYAMLCAGVVWHLWLKKQSHAHATTAWAWHRKIRAQGA